MQCDYLIVGAGIFGSVIAERLSTLQKVKVLVIDKRDHIGGNCFSVHDQETGIECHKYGTHIFHTSSRIVWDYISNFTEFNGYNHQVLTNYKGKVYQMPINLETINSFYGLNLTPEQARDFIQKEIKKAKIHNPKNLEEKAISMIGAPLYEAFIKGYTFKQWGKDPKQLPADIITRIPVRFNYREDYFNDCRWQGIPIGGYTSVFKKMLESKNIQVKVNCDYFSIRDVVKVNNKTIFTGPIDKFYDYKLGKLEWRSVGFEKKIVPASDFQGTSVMNYAEEIVPYTRIHEPKHLHPEREFEKNKTVIFYEYPRTGSDDESYPINNKINQNLYSKYVELASLEKDVIFGGRLGNYTYYDMDKAILSALDCVKNIMDQKRRIKL